MSQTARLDGRPKLRDPQDVLDYVWDWSAWLPDGDTISTFSVIITDDSGTPLVEDSSSNDDTSVTVWLSGGTLSTTPSVTVRITTAQARTADATKNFSIVSL